MDLNKFKFFHVKRYPDQGVIFGICAGFAKQLDVSPVYVRAFFVLGFLLSAGLFFWGYIILRFLLDEAYETQWHDTSDQIHSHYSKKHERLAGPQVSFQISDVSDKMTQLENRLRLMESYVTSKKFALDREFKKL
ncbi:PspC domain-containing protein [Algicola sagamiensis]|uniref:PspC domain-containing protein n=1 Tax=Algicola sagamiensis TaxID=163869 RepID=UPI00035EE887|nr:PspC domain-containing protein [Algicola sagamiensis]